MASVSRTGTHQLLLLVGAVALAGGLYALPKGIVKPKEGKAEMNQDAARTATRDGGGMATNGSKTEASSGPRPAETGTVAGAPDGAAAPHTQASAAQRKELNSLLAQYKAGPNEATRRPVATALAERYAVVQRFDSAGYYLTLVATAQPSEKAWQQAADAYFQGYKFAVTEERRKMLGSKSIELYDKVLAANPNNLDAKTNLGMAYMSTDNPVKGIGLMREVLEQDPKNQNVLYNLGTLAMESNQFDKATERFGELVKLNPSNVNAQFYLGIALARTNRGAEARQALLKAKSLSNDPALAASVEEAIAKLP
jgi:tetratricopeptide (TPR) repeat protein